VVTCDPTNYYLNDNYLNHPDHRAAGEIVVDAVFPASQNKLYFPELLSEQLSPHHVEEVWYLYQKKRI
jgi:LmbE family N-acetylglucosaminyl deacetylase